MKRGEKLVANQSQRLDPGIAVWHRKGRYGIEKGWPIGGKKEITKQKTEETKEKTDMTEESTENIEEKSQKLAASQTKRFGPGMAVWHRKGLAPRREEGREPGRPLGKGGREREKRENSRQQDATVQPR